MKKRPMVSREALKKIREEDAKRSKREADEFYRAMTPCSECGQAPPCVHTSADNR